MTSLSTDRIRNVVLLGQSGVGKTSLAEALLARAGAINRSGRVDDGTSVLDSEPESIKRRMSLSLSLAPFEWTGPDGTVCRVNLIDCPGYPDFVAEAEAAMSVADLAVMVVSAVHGVEVTTELLWRRAAELGLPRLVVVNKDDKERADFDAVLEQLPARLGGSFAPLELPIGEASSLHGIADVLSDQAFDYATDGTRRTTEMPAELADREHHLHDLVVEEIVAGDDDQLKRYLGGEIPTVAELEHTLANEVLCCTEHPVLVTSASTGIGVDRLADFICDLGPSPAARPVTVIAGDATVQVPADPAGQTLIHVFKTVADPFVGQLSVFKVLSGTLRTDDRLVNSRSGHEERLHALFQLRGKEQSAVPCIVAGDIGAVAKLASTRTGDTLSIKGSPVRVVVPDRVVPQHGVAIVPRTQADDDRLGDALSRLQAEDPVLAVDRDDTTKQTVLRGLGDIHIAVTLERLARKFGVAVDTVDRKVPYLETITGSAAVVGKVKKQSGGHGQFAVVSMRVAPTIRGEGFRFTDSVVGGAIPRNYLPAVQKGVEEAMVAGGVHGFPVVDVHVDCYDGKFHSVDSSEMAFKTAAAQGFREALAGADAGAVVLEPISELTVTAPLAQQGDIITDIISRRGRVSATSVTDDGHEEVVASVPTRELSTYTVDLRSMTGGRGRFTISHLHYDVLPANLLSQVKPPAAK